MRDGTDYGNCEKAGISEEDLEVYGKYKAKVSLDVLKKEQKNRMGN